MYQRMYGTSHRAPAHRFVPIEHEAWLRLQSPALTVKRVISGTGGLILVTALLFPLGNMGLVPEVGGVIMVLLTALAVLFSLFTLAGVVYGGRGTRSINTAPTA